MGFFEWWVNRRKCLIGEKKSLCYSAPQKDDSEVASLSLSISGRAKHPTE